MRVLCVDTKTREKKPRQKKGRQMKFSVYGYIDE